ncbi:MAG TPA: hypothetical protein G4O03_04585 [Dehalococcoidia bacterium]|nr:hypothetical protein [Dehalococcoidia bacterium]
MIITRTPIRISLGGGGTDLASYYSKYGGFTVAATINKHIYVTVNKRFEDSLRVSYSKTEIVDKVSDIQHPIVREALKLLGLNSGLEITTIADVPARTGLGSSSSFAVGLLNALHTYKKETVSARTLAEEACHIEIDILKEPIGKQDQFVASIGGILCLNFGTDGQVTVTPLRISPDTLDELERRLMFFYTGITRPTSTVLSEQNKAGETNESKVIESLHRVKEIGFEVKEALEGGNIRRFGELLDLHWQTKKNLSSRVSNPDIDRWYDIAKENDAIGGKIMGAGGGGFFIFYVEGNKNRLREALVREGLREERFRFEPEGSKVLVNL